jgi:Cu/Ag efflux protein CusF
MNALIKTDHPTRTKFISMVCMVAAIGVGVFQAAAQSDTNNETPRVVLSQTNHIKATVEDIDYQKREVSLKGPDGNIVHFAVSDAVKNFPQMKKGDVVSIGYYESLALAIAKPGETLPATSRSEAMAARPAGQKPGAAAMAVTDTTATVEDIDRDKREVTLRGMDGQLFKVVADPSVGNLTRIKKGDEIKATRTEALAISVDAADTKSETP